LKRGKRDNYNIVFESTVMHMIACISNGPERKGMWWKGDALVGSSKVVR